MIFQGDGRKMGPFAGIFKHPFEAELLTTDFLSIGFLIPRKIWFR